MLFNGVLCRLDQCDAAFPGSSLRKTPEVLTRNARRNAQQTHARYGGEAKRSPDHYRRRKALMLLRKRLTVFLAAAMMLTMMSAAPAFAHHCTNVSKKEGVGSI